MNKVGTAFALMLYCCGPVQYGLHGLTTDLLLTHVRVNHIWV